MGAIKLITALMFATIFAFAIVNYTFGFANDNNAAINLSTDSELSNLESGIRSNVTTIKTDISGTSDSIYESVAEPDSDTTKTPGAYTLLWKGGKNTMNLITTTFNTKIFGGDVKLGVVTLSVSALLVFLIVMYVIKLWRQGNPD